VVEATLNITMLTTPAGRDAVLMLLRPSLNLPKRYVFYAVGTMAMANLEAVIVKHLPPAGRPHP
jgi:hypothetical protein